MARVGVRHQGVGQIGVTVVGFGIALRPKQSVGQHMAHARPEAVRQGLVEVAQGCADGGLQVGAQGEQAGQGGTERFASTGEDPLEPLKTHAHQHALWGRELVFLMLLRGNNQRQS